MRQARTTSCGSVESHDVKEVAIILSIEVVVNKYQSVLYSLYYTEKNEYVVYITIAIGNIEN